MRRACLAMLACGLLLPAAAHAAKDPVLGTLSQIEARGGAAAADAQAWRDDYRTAKVAAKRLSGTPQANIRGVLLNLTSLAKRHLLGSRAYPAFLILRHNLEWFYEQRRAAPAYGARTTFPGSELIFQYYPGSGWQLQPLANFGRLNGLLKLKKPAAGRLEKFADDMLATGVQRRGSLAFEYYFPWDGGAPGWISGMATATGMQAFANLGARDGDVRYTNAARSMIGVFKAPPPWGVTVQGQAGPSFLLYSQSPSTLVGNGFAQALIALDNYRATTGDADATALVDAALAEAKRLLPLYDTGAWSLYERTPTKPGVESDLSYHQLFEGFLKTLCTKFAEPFCTEADDFARYETEPVQITSVAAKVQVKRKRIVASFSLNKRGTIRATLARDDGRVVRAWSGSMYRGGHTLTWTLPPKGDYTLDVRATSLNGIASEASSQATVARSARSPRHR
jgi:D-glucuronyl C5-epimerase-like protein